MKRTTATFPVSLPPEMMEELEQVRRVERRTRSELAPPKKFDVVQDALTAFGLQLAPYFL